MELLRPTTQTGEEAEVDDPSLDEWMRSAGRLRRWDDGTTVFHQGDRSDFVVLLRTGVVKVVSYASSGKQVVLALRGRGALLGEFAALDGGPRSAGVLALSDVQGWVVSSAELLAHLTASPPTAVALLRLLVSRLREADLRRLEFGSLDTTGRTASLLCTLDAEYGPGEWIRLTQTELGEAVGSSREATVKALSRLRRSGLVDTARSRVRVLQPVALARVVDEGVEPVAAARGSAPERSGTPPRRSLRQSR